VVAGSAIHGHTLTRQNNQKAPAPTPQGQAEADQDRHPARVKTKGAAEEPKKGEELALLILKIYFRWLRHLPA